MGKCLNLRDAQGCPNFRDGVVLTSGIQRSAVEQYAVDGVELKVENCGVVLSQLGLGIGVESTRSTSGNLLQTRKGIVLNKGFFTNSNTLRNYILHVLETIYRGGYC